MDRKRASGNHHPADTMKPKIVRLHSPDVQDLTTFSPGTESFSFLVQIIASPEGVDGEESFDLAVCSPSWVSEHVEHDGCLIGRHYLIVSEYNYDSLLSVVTEFAANCTGNTWKEVASKLGRLGRWEFEDYNG